MSTELVAFCMLLENTVDKNKTTCEKLPCMTKSTKDRHPLYDGVLGEFNSQSMTAFPIKKVFLNKKPLEYSPNIKNITWLLRLQPRTSILLPFKITRTNVCVCEVKFCFPKTENHLTVVDCTTSFSFCHCFVPSLHLDDACN